MHRTVGSTVKAGEHNRERGGVEAALVRRTGHHGGQVLRQTVKRQATVEDMARTSDHGVTANPL